ncbi:DUF4245 domain-containing protein [Streptomyces sp. SL13]|jgi:hypothetical protein|uniref:DUF4245 domain-containing protein n=1 Tax=Streptantibioticus silvisoli TaxID=2705255 RepID=A0AA90H2X2_9ACTN|nr:DUF4245 domain-containing protein [Streptantibioticus silvisoli]MDI5970013.1 DUF4245 domain-containing protein [Streptantibioticus silvisoli]
MGDHGEVAEQRGKQTVRDMVLSIAVIGVVVAGVYVFIPRSGHDPVHPVSYRVELDLARRAAPYPVAGPSGLSRQWRATSVSYDGADPRADHWHLGFIDPQNQYAAIEQTNAGAASFIASVTQQSHRDGTQTVSGTTWQRYGGGRYRALARTTTGAHGGTTVVLGTAPYSQLAQLAGALRTS